MLELKKFRPGKWQQAINVRDFIITIILNTEVQGIFCPVQQKGRKN